MTREELVKGYEFLNPNGVMIEKVEHKEFVGRIKIPDDIREEKTRAAPIATVLKISTCECDSEEREVKKGRLEEGMKIHFANAAQTIPGGFEDYPNIQIIHIDDVVGILPS